MKIKLAHRPDWSRILLSRFAMREVHDEILDGFISLYAIDAIREPLRIRHYDPIVTIADVGYQWLQVFPKDKPYIITIIFNNLGELIRWYIDISKPYYLNEAGIPCYEDLYLDLDIAQNGTVTLLDVDELDEALAKGEVSHLHYELAWKEAHQLMLAIEDDRVPLLWSGEAYREQLIALLA